MERNKLPILCVYDMDKVMAFTWRSVTHNFYFKWNILFYASKVQRDVSHFENILQLPPFTIFYTKLTT